MVDAEGAKAEGDGEEEEDDGESGDEAAEHGPVVTEAADGENDKPSDADEADVAAEEKHASEDAGAAESDSGSESGGDGVDAQHGPVVTGESEEESSQDEAVEAPVEQPAPVVEVAPPAAPARKVVMYTATDGTVFEDRAEYRRYEFETQYTFKNKKEETLVKLPGAISG